MKQQLNKIQTKSPSQCYLELNHSFNRDRNLKKFLSTEASSSQVWDITNAVTDDPLASILERKVEDKFMFEVW